MPERTCVGCRRVDQQQNLLRIAFVDDRYVLSRTAPGRGAWVHPGCGERAAKRRAVPRALRRTPGTDAGLETCLAEVDARHSAWANGSATR